MKKVYSFVVMGMLALGGGPAQASIAYGTINNFDTVNDTGVECHGFEIELEDIRSTDITYTYSWNHYGTPKITEDHSDPIHTNRVFVRYESGKNSDGSWAAYTAVPSGPIPPTQGHQFTNPGTNFGGEHFGVGYRAVPSSVKYNWLIDNGAGVLVHGGAVNIATPTFTYIPPAAGAPAMVQAAIVPPPPPEPDPREFGAASWVKEIRTETHNEREVNLRDLVSDDPDDENDKNWRNGEPDEVEVEWQLLQTDYNKGDGGENGQLVAAPEGLPNGDEVVTRRYEFYKYLGPFDPESGEALAESVAPDGIHGVGLRTNNGVVVDLSTIIVVGEYLGSQMAAFDVDEPIGLIDHLEDGEVDVAYTDRTLVISATTNFAASADDALPEGMTFDAVTGVLSGTPVVSGVFTFTVHVSADDGPVVSRTYVFTIAEAGEVLPPHSSVVASVSPPASGTTSGTGVYAKEADATVTATPAAGFAFQNWTDNGTVVAHSPTYQFNVLVNSALVANFVPVPQLTFTMPLPNTLVITWPTNFSGFVLQQTSSLDPANWESASNHPISVAGTNSQVTVSPLTGSLFLRLVRP